MNMQQRALTDAIRERMGLEGRTATWVQERAGVSPSAWHNYFHGGRDMRYSTIRAIAGALNTTAGAIVARAEAREVELATDPVQHFTSQIADPDVRAAVEAEAAKVAERRRRSQTNG